MYAGKRACVRESFTTAARTVGSRIVDWYMDRKINIDDLITRVLPLERISEAFDLMRKGKSIHPAVVY